MWVLQEAVSASQQPRLRGLNGTELLALMVFFAKTTLGVWNMLLDFEQEGD
jgi:hypothetical protein